MLDQLVALLTRVLGHTVVHISTINVSRIEHDN